MVPLLSHVHCSSGSALVYAYPPERQHLRDMPGQRLEFLQPIEMRMNEMVTGSRGDVAIKLYGDDLDILTAKGKEIAEILSAYQRITFDPMQIEGNFPELTKYYGAGLMIQFGQEDSVLLDRGWADHFENHVRRTHQLQRISPLL